ncbi:MAG TPA: F0F1 ATP synthase subunit epsilon [Candidatus Copromorpha excrementigallinarum]|uniref:ATP synthase epsilon chain n=1 Tax=Candidatus Allocopromorpha excrementigallinarum TaxID=2840742 RepID=A0A9D1L5C3_9FIRM|nr:F0F1 ATP synthase subunit epsilon [Candidatus Copromorpha excrementigallinarum]
MANSVKLEIMTPSKMFYRGDVELVIVRTLEGDEGFMYGHSWACKLLDIGGLWLQEKGAPRGDFRVAAVAGGFIDVKDSIVIYTDAVEWKEDIDMERALSEKAKAEDWLRKNEESGDPNDVIKAKIAILKAITRSKVAEGNMIKRG